MSAPIGTAGASAKRIYLRRHEAREKRVRANFPRIGGVILRLYRDPQTIRAWEVGAQGEQMLARRLDALCADGFVVIHDRRIPGARANIDHIVIAPSGVHVIDAKHYSGKIQVRRRSFLNAQSQLRVGRRDCTRLIEPMMRQVLATDEVLKGLAEAQLTPVTAVLCFIGVEWPIFFSKEMAVEGVRITWGKNLERILRRPGPLTDTQIEAIGRRLAERLTAA